MELHKIEEKDGEAVFAPKKVCKFHRKNPVLGSLLNKVADKKETEHLILQSTSCWMLLKPKENLIFSAIVRISFLKHVDLQNVQISFASNGD